jgi:hypothetical protein
MREALLRTVELGLLVPAFALLIPPVASDAGQQRYGLFPGLAFGTVLFGISQALACRRGAERWDAAVLKVLLFCGLGVAIWVRVWEF